MRKYVIYEEVPDWRDNRRKEKYYHKGNGDVTLQEKDAKVYEVKNWIEFIVTILQFVIKLFGNGKLKYKQIK